MVFSDMVLANIKQGERESLRDYTNRIFVAAAEVEDVDPTVAMHNFRRGLKVGDLSKSLHLAKPRSYPKLVARASQFMFLEDVESSPPDISRVKQEKRKRKHRGDEPPAPKIHMAKNRDQDEGKPRHIQHQKHFSLGLFLKSMRRPLNKGGSNLSDPSQRLRSEWIPTIIVSSTGTTGTSFTGVVASELCSTNWQIRASSKSSCIWRRPSLLPRKERLPKSLGILLKTCRLQVPANKSVLTPCRQDDQCHL
ncbi:hypothetical protein AXF42_Ash013226 [Apostasia shenzhenica]|uniref:Retrotransposon gag domain-containing protein n=1 Tax=Apostasia shenzhenica TaxID=1088818 RepID=A0A2I0BBD3_9ASPA|nr:hypothetical protein AXF42_Ash013226 [Apostasia shenzhenica]